MKNTENKEKLAVRLKSMARRHSVPGSHIEINGNTEVILEGCRGLMEYGSDCIRVSMGRQVVTVIGSNLSIRNMFSQILAVDGHIISVELS